MLKVELEKELQKAIDDKHEYKRLLHDALDKINWLETHSQNGQQSTMIIALEKVTDAVAHVFSAATNKRRW